MKLATKAACPSSSSVQTCDSSTLVQGLADSVTSTVKNAMGFGSCDLKAVFDYKESTKDIWINYVTLALTMGTLILCTWKAGKFATKHARTAPWFWIPFTLVLFGMQLFADCSTNNVGISAVWSAFAGFLFLGQRRMRGTVWKGPSGSAGTAYYATTVSLIAWVGVCVYYAFVEEAMTTVAHLVAFAVGAGALLIFEKLHQIPSEVGVRKSVVRRAGENGPSYNSLQ